MLALVETDYNAQTVASSLTSVRNEFYLASAVGPAAVMTPGVVVLAVAELQDGNEFLRSVHLSMRGYLRTILLIPDHVSLPALVTIR